MHFTKHLLLPSFVAITAVSWASNASSRDIEHVVRPGENLFRIALIYGLDYGELVSLNNIDDPNSIFVGQTIIVGSESSALPVTTPPTTTDAPTTVPDQEPTTSSDVAEETTEGPETFTDPGNPDVQLTVAQAIEDLRQKCSGESADCGSRTRALVDAVRGTPLSKNFGSALGTLSTEVEDSFEKEIADAVQGAVEGADEGEDKVNAVAFQLEVFETASYDDPTNDEDVVPTTAAGSAAEITPGPAAPGGSPS